jgi:exonuclease SbcC
VSKKAQNDIDYPLNKEKLQQEQKEFQDLLTKEKIKDVESAQANLLSDDILQGLETEVNAYHDEVTKYGALVADDIKNGYDKIIYDKSTNFDELLKEKSDALQASSTSLANLSSKLNSNKACLQRVEDSYANSKVLLTKANEIHLLYQTASGSLTGGVPHIDFEVYYQAQIFEEILQVASKKFSIMSDGRYSLLRREAPSKKSDKFGLDIDVQDYQTGKIRSVASLSGGESFMASLSLALSLSETIQAKAGGVELDSMFIDEGFGSLDAASLSLAMKVLNNLSNNSHRLIGIISHVETLKDVIPSKIEVSKTTRGSTLKCIYE